MMRHFSFLLLSCVLSCTTPNKKNAPKYPAISAGSNCAARYNIEKYYYDGESISTNFFDWVISDMTTVNTVLRLSHSELKSAFTKEQLHFENTGGEHLRVKSAKIPNFISIHDISPKNPLDDEIKVFSEKYTRRFDRLIEQIKDEKTIFFVYFNSGSIGHQDVEQFFKELEAIKPSNQHYLLAVGLNGDAKDFAELEKSYRFKFFNLAKRPIRNGNVTGGWTHDQYDWDRVFLGTYSASLSGFCCLDKVSGPY